jgi:branched-chain amino acid transport system substrate-binding protein
MEHLGKAAGKKFERPAIVHEDTDFGQSIAKGVAMFLKEKGYTLVQDISYPSPIADVTPIITKLKASKADVVFRASYVAEEILFKRASARLDYNVPVLIPGVNPYSVMRSLGVLAENEMSVAFWNKDIDARSKSLNDRYKAKAKDDMNTQPAYLYQAMWVIKEALELAKKADRESLRASLTKIRIEPGPNLFMPWKFIKFGEDGMNTGGMPIILQVQGGNYVTVFPQEFARGAVKVDPNWGK